MEQSWYTDHQLQAYKSPVKDARVTKDSPLLPLLEMTYIQKLNVLGDCSASLWLCEGPSRHQAKPSLKDCMLVIIAREYEYQRS